MGKEGKLVMNKKGFTLVELLAVIAILAILVIIALPNVLEMYRNARKNTFLREVASVYDAGHTKYFLNAFGGATKTMVYTDVTTTATDTDTLDLQGGNANFHYCLIMDNNGNATKLEVSNGTYHYTSTDTMDDIKQVQDTSKYDITDDSSEVSTCNAS